MRRAYFDPRRAYFAPRIEEVSNVFLSSRSIALSMLKVDLLGG